MLNLILRTSQISAFLKKISPRRPHVEGTVIILQGHSKRETDVKFVNNDIC